MTPQQRRNRQKKRMSENIRFLCDVPVVLKAEEGESLKVVPFSAVAYSGGLLRVDGFKEPVVVDMQGVLVAGDKLPMTLDHERDQRVGHADEVKLTADAIQIHGSTSAETPYRDEVIDSARNGYAWQLSIEGRVRSLEKVSKGRRVHVNGRWFDGPVIIARSFLLRAVSFVSLGGDEETQLSLAAQSESGDEDMEFSELMSAFKELDMSAEEKEALAVALGLKAQVPPEEEESDSETPPEDDEKEAEASAKDFRKRVAQEARIVAELQKVCDGDMELFAKATEGNWSVDKTKLEKLLSDREAQTPSIHVGGSREPENYGEILEASLCLQAGLKEDLLGKHYSDRVMNAAMARENRGVGLHTLMYTTLRNAGKSVRPGVVDNDFVRASMRADQQLNANEGTSTVTTTGVLSNVLNKILLSAYETYPMIASQLASIRDVPDFKQVSSYRITTNGLLEVLGDTGEIKHTDLTETEFSNQLKTYARMLAIPRQMQINDDLGAFTEAASQFGRMAARTIDFVFHEILLANADSFFHADNANYLAGAETALGIASLTAAEKLFLDLEDDAGYPAAIEPRNMLVSTGNKVTAEQLYNDTRVVTGEDATILEGNPHAGKYPPITSQWLNKTAHYANASDVGWYLFSDPADGGAIQLVYLRGARTPVVESSQLDFNQLGMQWRAYHDFGIAFQDPKKAVFMLGEAA